MTVERALVAGAAALLAWALCFGGGDSPNRLAWIGGAAIVAATLLAAAALLGRIERPRLGRSAAAAVACFAALVVWQGISITWSVQPDRSWDAFNRGVVYLAFLVVGTFVGALVRRPTRVTAAALAVLLALALGYALLAKGIPALYPDYARLARLRSPIGYWNALAVLADFALVLGLWRAAARRLDGVLLVYLATVSLLLAYSRGGVVIAAIAVAAWLVLDRRRLESLVALAIGGGAGVAVFGIALALNGVTDDGQPHSARVHDGALFLLAFVVGGALVAALARFAQRARPSEPARRRATLVLLAALALVGVGGAVAAALHTGAATTANAAGTHCTEGAGRLACGSSDARLDWWREAWQSFEDEPLHGTGAASFELAHRLRRDEFTRPVTEPHNLALQALGETGIVGFALFAGAVVLAGLAIRRRLRGDDAAVALAVCVLAYLAHVLIDIGYDYVAVGSVVFTLLGVLLTDSKASVARREPLWAAATLALGATALLSLAAPYVSQRKLDDAIVRADPDLAAQAHDWNPTAIEPLLTQAALVEAQGRRLKALALYRDAVDTQPDEPDAWAELGRFQLYGLRNPCAAFRSLERAYELDRFDPVVATNGGALDVARAQARRRGCA